ncbi:hypothetical protein EDB92DRAFT_1900254, partial [Lactarius akahatsu]
MLIDLLMDQIIISLSCHTAHINLNNEHLPYKHIIGQVILDKNKRLRMVSIKSHPLNC